MYEADNYVRSTEGGTSVTTNPIANTENDSLYQSQRYGIFTYELPVIEGNYNVTLKFAEQYADANGVRIMSAVAEGVDVVSNVDLFSTAGFESAHDVTVNNIEVTDGSLTIRFTASANYATLSGLLVTTVDGDIGVPMPEPMPTTPTCEGSDNYLCLDFDDTAVGEIPSGWGVHGTSPTVSDGDSLSGDRSLRVSGRDYASSGYITYPNIPSKHFGRLYYKLDEVNAINYLHITFVELRGLTSGFPARVVDTNLSGNDLGRMKYIFNIDTYPGPEYNISSPEIFSYYDAQDRWICVEWSVDPATQHGALWAEGVLAYDAVQPYNNGQKQIPENSFESIAIGLRTYKGAFSSGWIDDVVVGPERIGCDR